MNKYTSKIILNGGIKLKILNRGEKKRWSKAGGVAHLNSGVREDISEKVTFELRQKGGKVVSQAQTALWGRAFPAEEKQGMRPGGRNRHDEFRGRESLHPHVLESFSNEVIPDYFKLSTGRPQYSLFLFAISLH